MALAAVAATAGVAQAIQASPNDLRMELGRALQTPGVAPRRTGAIALDLETGSIVFQQNHATALLSASTEKLPVSFAALKVLGPRYRFRTELVGAGARRDTTWQGNLWLVGFGDPTLGRGDLDRLARKLAATGIRRVQGRVFGDESHFDARRDGRGWKSSYLGLESRPLSALSVEGVRITGPNGSAVAAARAYVDALRRRGIAVSGRSGARRAPADAISITFDLSAPLGEVLRLVNGESDNFAAEMLLKELGASSAGQGSSAAGSRVVRKSLRDAGVPLAGIRIADGSGLSRYDRLTASGLVALLRAGATDPAVRATFVASLAVAGISGTLEERLDRPPTRGRVLAKTGTTTRASALAGFVGRKYAFAILQNGDPVPHRAAQTAQDRFVTVLARS